MLRDYISAHFHTVSGSFIFSAFELYSSGEYTLNEWNPARLAISSTSQTRNGGASLFNLSCSYNTLNIDSLLRKGKITDHLFLSEKSIGVELNLLFIYQVNEQVVWDTKQVCDGLANPCQSSYCCHNSTYETDQQIDSNVVIKLKDARNQEWNQDH